MDKPQDPAAAETAQIKKTPAVDLPRLVSRLQNYVRDMDARITMARVEIREKQAAVGQLEQEKWKLESEVDKIASMISSAND